jgi:hypothetical protein
VTQRKVEGRATGFHGSASPRKPPHCARLVEHVIHLPALLCAAPAADLCGAAPDGAGFEQFVTLSPAKCSQVNRQVAVCAANLDDFTDRDLVEHALDQ